MSSDESDDMLADAMGSETRTTQRPESGSETIASERNQSAEFDEIKSGDEIDWPAVWDECGIDADSMMSVTQLRLAVDVSSETGGAGPEQASELLDEAFAGNQLVRVRRKASKATDTNTGAVTAGYHLPEESR